MALGIQHESNLLTPDGALETCRDRNQLQWGSFPPGTVIPFPPPGWSGITPPFPGMVLGSSHGGLGPGARSPNIIPILTPTPGSTLVIALGSTGTTFLGGTNPTYTAVKDNFGNAFTQIPGAYQAQIAGIGGDELSTVDLWYLPGVAAGITSIEVDFANGGGVAGTACNVYLSAFELVACTLMDSGSNNGVGTAISSPVLTLPHKGFFISNFNVLFSYPGFFTFTPGWTPFSLSEYLNATGSQQSNVVASFSTTWIECAAAFG